LFGDFVHARVGQCTGDEDFLFGAAVSMTGRLAKESSLLKKGYETWADWINGQGGINVGGGSPIKLK